MKGATEENKVSALTLGAALLALLSAAPAVYTACIPTKVLGVYRARLAAPGIGGISNADVVIFLATPFNTPMAYAEVIVTKMDGTALSLTADAQGRIVVPDVPRGVVDVTVLMWNGMPINYKAVGVTTGVVVVPTIGKLIVTVVGARGQGLEGAIVRVQGDGIVVFGASNTAGLLTVELPAGTYTVIAEKSGKTASASVLVVGSRITELTLKIDIFMTIAGWEMSFSEFVGLLLLIAVLTLLLFIASYEYTVWRRRRLARAIASTRPEGGA